MKGYKILKFIVVLSIFNSFLMFAANAFAATNSTNANVASSASAAPGLEILQNLPKPPNGTIPSAIVTEKNAETHTGFEGLTDTSKPILLAPNQKSVVISLAANPTTGYSWFLKNFDRSLLNLHSHQFMPTSKLVGSGGVDQWIFDINSSAYVAPQVTDINFVYKRPWEKTDAKTLTISVIS